MVFTSMTEFFWRDPSPPLQRRIQASEPRGSAAASWASSCWGQIITPRSDLWGGEGGALAPLALHFKID